MIQRIASYAKPYVKLGSPTPVRRLCSFIWYPSWLTKQTCFHLLHVWTTSRRSNWYYCQLEFGAYYQQKPHFRRRMQRLLDLSRRIHVSPSHTSSIQTIASSWWLSSLSASFSYDCWLDINQQSCLLVSSEIGGLLQLWRHLSTQIDDSKWYQIIPGIIVFLDFW
jgi:hypothetical protein